MTNFGQFLGKMGETGIFFKKALGTFLSRLEALTNCKVSEKSNEWFSTNQVMNGRTDVSTYERMNERESLRSTDFVGRPKRT